MTDNGILTSMSQLPVTQLNYGGSSRPISWIEYNLGKMFADYLMISKINYLILLRFWTSFSRPFVCTGKSKIFPSEIRSTNFEFMIAANETGIIIQKNYPVKLNQIVYDKTLGYLNPNGTFTAPVDGLYRFELQESIDDFRVQGSILRVQRGAIVTTWVIF